MSGCYDVRRRYCHRPKVDIFRKPHILTCCIPRTPQQIANSEERRCAFYPFTVIVVEHL